MESGLSSEGEGVDVGSNFFFIEKPNNYSYQSIFVFVNHVWRAPLTLDYMPAPQPIAL